MNREAIYSALFNIVKASANFKTVSRKIRLKGDLPEEEMPALYQLQVSEKKDQVQRMPAKYFMTVDLWIYATVDDGDTAPSSTLNPLIDAIETALAPDAITGVQNLGLDNVSHCWTESVEIFENILGNVIMAIMPVNILAT